MPAGSLLTLLDDIASILDDVSILTKKAAAKTAGVLGDDLALNAQQVNGVVANRELPVVWAVAKGSFVNKLILVPMALVIGTFIPWGVLPLLMIGGIYLCYEGCEKLVHHLLHRRDKKADIASEEIAVLAADLHADAGESESKKIKGAVRTDFVLSAEIIAITLGTVDGQGFGQQLMVLSAIAVIMTVGVYGLVAGIVKLDDLGLFLVRCGGSLRRGLGSGILWMAPFLMKTLTVAGTAAMFLVGGGIITHGIPPVHHWIEHTAKLAAHAGEIAGFFAPILPTAINGICGVVAGLIALLVHTTWQKCFRKAELAH